MYPKDLKDYLSDLPAYQHCLFLEGYSDIAAIANILCTAIAAADTQTLALACGFIYKDETEAILEDVCVNELAPIISELDSNAVDFTLSGHKGLLRLSVPMKKPYFKAHMLMILLKYIGHAVSHSRLVSFSSQFSDFERFIFCDPDSKWNQVTESGDDQSILIASI